MKPRPTQSKSQQYVTGEISEQEVRKRLEKSVPTRTIYVRNDERTEVGFKTHAGATDYADTVMPAGPNGSRENEQMRVRVAFRRRTGLYDVVVKLAKEVPIVEQKAIGE